MPWVCWCSCAVSSDFRHTSSGNLCTAWICPWSLSTSKLSRGLLLSLSSCLSLLSFHLFHFIIWCHHSHSNVQAAQVILCLCLFPIAVPLSLFPAFFMGHHYSTALCLPIECIMSSHASAFLVRSFNVTLKSAHSLGKFRAGAHQEPFSFSFACVRTFSFTVNLYLCVCVCLCVCTGP